MGFTESIRNGLNSLIGNNNIFKFNFCDKTFCYNGVYFLRKFFTIFESENSGSENKWEVELSLPLIDSCWNQNTIDLKTFLKNYTIALLEKFGIKNQGNVIPIVSYDDVKIIKEFSNTYDECYDEIASLSENIIAIKDKSKIGKTLFMKACCQKFKQNQNTDKVWWLDFNCGFTDISNFISSLYEHRFDKINYIVIDNIECCGLYNSQKLLNFLVDFVAKINAKKTYIKLFIILDNEYGICLDNNTSVKICENILSDNVKFELLQTVEQIQYSNIKSEIEHFLSSNIYKDDKDNIKIKTLLLNLIYFAKFGVNLKINQDEKFNVDKQGILKILEYNSGIKLTKSGEILCYSKEVCEQLLIDFQNKFFEILEKFNGCGSILLDKTNNCYNKNVLACYYAYIKENELPISIVDMYSVLKNLPDENTYAKDLEFILEKAEQANNAISVNVNNSKEDEYLNNHLGTILFAMESLASYAEKDYNSLQAWIKLRNYIRKTFYISNSEPMLPSIRDGKSGVDKTINDFKITHNRFNQNCIETQIQLHDEVLNLAEVNSDVISSDDIITLMNNGVFNDTLFNFYISSLQKEAESKIDIEKFYRTYILALLFEAEVTAPDELVDELRIRQLWAIVRKNVIESDDNYSYYPVLIPWLTARMVLAMNIYSNRYPTSEISNEIRKLKESFAKYFVKTNIGFTYNDKQYCFWSAGTGLWNSTLETTIMCALTLKGLLYTGNYKKTANNGVNFINLFKNEWFDDNMLADGIWAYQATFDRQDICRHITDFKRLISNFKFFKNDSIAKNDKSLGFSHITKTLIDIAKDFISVKPDLLNYPKIICEDEERGDSENNGLESEDTVSAVTEKTYEPLTKTEAIKFRKTLLAQISRLNTYKDDPNHIVNPYYSSSIEKCERLVEAVRKMLVGLSDTNYAEREKRYNVDLLNQIHIVIGG